MIFEAAPQFEVNHYIAGLGATMTAAASLLGAIAALGFTKKKATEKAKEGNSTATDAALLEAYERGVTKGAELARQNA